MDHFSKKQQIKVISINKQLRNTSSDLLTDWKKCYSEFADKNVKEDPIDKAEFSLKEIFCFFGL